MSSPDKNSDPLMELFSLFMRNSMHSAYLHARETGLSMPQVITLMALFKKGGVAISEIAEKMGVSNAAASQMVDRMVHEGLILRTEDPDDRRAKQINLTEKGRQLALDNFHARHNWHQKLIETLSPDEKEQVHRAFELLASKISLLEHHPNSALGNHPKK